MFTIPSVTDFKAYFNRDFPYGCDIALSVTNQDVDKALKLAGINFNQCLFENQDSFDICYLLLSAHFLVMNIRSSSQGISGSYEWNQTSKSVGSVSEGLQIPQRIMENPEMAMLTKTNYGAQYLMLILPLLIGNMFVVAGATTP